MEEIKKEKEKEKKPFNVVLLGNIESEKAALLHKFIKKRFAIKQLKEMNISDEKGEEDSNLEEIMNSVEIHGETIRLKIWDNVSANKIFSSSNKSLKVAQGIILFYSVADRKSFNMLKLSLSKVIDFDKYDIPMIMVGNDSDNPKREVTYEEAKALADSYGLRFYETSIKTGMGDVFQDIGEQVFYQEYGDYSKSNSNKNNYNSISTSKSTKNINNKISIYSNNELYDNDFNNSLKNKLGKKTTSLFTLSRRKSSHKKSNNRKRSNDELNSDIDFEESIISYKNNNNLKNKNKSNMLIKSPDILINSSLLNSSSSIMFSYQGNTEAQKKREEEIRERRLKREKEMKTWWKKREKQNLENQKLKKKKEKEELQKKIKEDKINQKEKEKKLNEENHIKTKNNYEQKKKYLNEIEKGIITGKENKRLEKLQEKRNNKEKLNKLKEEKEKEIKGIYSNKNNKGIKKGITYNKSDSNIKKNKNNINKLRAKNTKDNKNSKNKDEILNSSMITLDEQEIIKQNLETKNSLIENYQKNSNIYRCLKCRLIPNIIINEYNQEIETYCDDSYNDETHHNITTYSNFQELSLNHPIDSNNIACYYCSKVINELSQEETIYYCAICNIYFCTEDEELHKAKKHKNYDNLKEKYLEITINKIKEINTKKNNILNTPSQNKKTKTLNKQSSTPLLFKKNNNKKESTQMNKGNIKKTIKENKSNKNINKSCDNNNSIILSEKRKEKNKNLNKIQIFLIDSYCDIHNELFKSYCFNCHKNICEICEDNHKNHNVINFEEILLDNEELIEKKNELNKAKEDLMKINDYFSALIEAIKCKFERLFNIKKKELEIKEKIIQDYETIRYNFHCINNIRNIRFDNTKNYIDKSSNTDWFHRFNLIFKYLNSDLNSKNNDIFDILNNRNEKKNIKIIKNKLDSNINKLIVLKNEDIAVSLKNGNIILYDKNNLNEKLNIKVFSNNLQINDFQEKEGGGLICCGYEYSKCINLSLNNTTYEVKEPFIYNEKSNFNSIIELNNQLYLTSDDNSKLKLWEIKNNSKKYKNLDCYDFNLENKNEVFNLLYKIKNDIFIFYSFINNNLYLFKINNFNKIELKSILENIRIIKGSNSIAKLSNEDYILLSCCQNIDAKNGNHLITNYKGDFSIILVDINNLNIIEKFIQDSPIIYINNYFDNIFISIDINGVIQKIEFDKYQQNLISLDKINYKTSFKLGDGKIYSINVSKNKNIILQLNNEIINISNID